MKSKLSRYSLATLIGLGLGASAFANAAQQTDTPTTEENSGTADKKPRGEDTIVVTAARQNLQAPGVSTITAEEIKKRPPARDISELIRTMPGVNLTGNSTSGQRGNNRQIDIRGMGPENTLILIDGKPASSRNSVRQGAPPGQRRSSTRTEWRGNPATNCIVVVRCAAPGCAAVDHRTDSGFPSCVPRAVADAG